MWKKFPSSKKIPQKFINLNYITHISCSRIQRKSWEALKIRKTIEKYAKGRIVMQLCDAKQAATLIAFCNENKIIHRLSSYNTADYILTLQ